MKPNIIVKFVVLGKTLHGSNMMKRCSAAVVMFAVALGGLCQMGIADDPTTQPGNSPATQTSPMVVQSTGSPKSSSVEKQIASAAEKKTAGVANAAKAAVSAKQTDSKPLGVADKQSNKFPTPAELMQRMRQVQTQQDKLPKVAYFDLAGPTLEKPADFSLFGKEEGLTLRVLIDRLESARHDNAVRAIFITLGDGSLNLSQALELRTELNSLHRDGKRTFVYADSYDTSSYLAACGATDICMMQGGDIMVPGVGFELMFAKDLLDKVGVKANYVQIGEYKGADEEFTRATASIELRGELNKLADSLYEQIIDTISLSRNISHDDVKELMDDALVTGRVAKNRGLVDHLVELDGMREMITAELGRKFELLTNYGAVEKDQVDLSSPFAFFALLNKKPVVSDRPAIGIVYAEGVIVDGDGGQGLFGGDSNVGSDTIRRALRLAERDDKIQAVVIRIDSPGGSALASEVMWQAVRRVAKTKPVIISIGSEAASGGYYLASSGEYIFADPTAIVGSIGVVGGKFVTHDLFEKLGLHTESFLRGRNSDLFSSSTDWTDTQRRQVTGWMHETYDQFTERVMTTRDGKIKDIDAIARGRIFSAKQAKDLGMVDRIGGVKDAIDYAANKVELEPGSYDVRVLPPAKTLADVFAAAGAGGSDAAMPFSPKLNISADSLINALPAPVRQSLSQEMQILMLLQQRPVVLAAPYSLTVK
ncbi:MAG: signal peptide peptidase SppA [Planctomycetota bacterium]|nr:signal peptide peptidase SppA [Planctomycetota bacterium]